MNSLERIRTVLRGELPDCVPVAPYISNATAKMFGLPLSEYYTNGKNMADVVYKAWEQFGYDVCQVNSDNYYMAEGLGLKTEISGDSLPLAKVRPLKRLQDGRNIQIADPYKDGRMHVYLEAIADLRSRLGNEVCIRGTGSGMFSLVSHLYGIEPLLINVAEFQFADEDEEIRDNIKAFKDLMEICTQTAIRFVTAEIEAGANMIQLGDSLSSLDVISPQTFREYIWPYFKEYFDALQPVFKKHNAYGILHVCGNNTKVLKDYAAAGPDIYEVDYKVDLKEAKQLIGGQLTLMGNIEPVYFLQASAKDLGEACRRAVEVGAPGGRYILGTGCETCIGTPAENIKAMVEAGHSYRY